MSYVRLNPADEQLGITTSNVTSATAGNLTAWRSGNVVSVHGVGVALSAALANTANVQVGQLADGFPKRNAYFGLYRASYGCIGYGWVTTAGVLAIKNDSGASIAAGTSLYFQGTYVTS